MLSYIHSKRIPYLKYIQYRSTIKTTKSWYCDRLVFYKDLLFSDSYFRTKTSYFRTANIDVMGQLTIKSNLLLRPLVVHVYKGGFISRTSIYYMAYSYKYMMVWHISNIHGHKILVPHFVWYISPIQYLCLPWVNVCSPIL